MIDRHDIERHMRQIVGVILYIERRRKKGLRLTRGNAIDVMIDELAIYCKDVPNDSSSS